MRERGSARAASFGESVIREMSRLAAAHNAVNLAQGFPDFACPDEVKHAACAAVEGDINQYSVTWGDPALRQAVAEKESRFLGLPIDPETELTVTCGATEGMVASVLATVDPGDEVVVFEPFYENYWPAAVISGAVPRYVRLQPPAWTFDEDELAQAFNDRTRAIIINTPHNPTGKVFSRAELACIASHCRARGVIAITDEIYQHILYDGREHVAIASLPGMKDLTITISGLSKTYAVTGWRIGTVIAPEDLTLSIRRMHDYLTVGAPAPLQRAGVTALQLPASYYQNLAAFYAGQRERMLAILEEAGIPFFRPEGSYFVLTDVGGFGFETDTAFIRFLIEDIGVAAVPCASFFSRPKLGYRYVRFCFGKKTETLEAARQRLQRLPSLLPRRPRNENQPAV